MNLRVLFQSALTLSLAVMASCNPQGESGAAATSDADYPEEVKKLLSEMTVEEKAGQLTILNLTVLVKTDTVTGAITLDTAKLTDILVNHKVGNILNTHSNALTDSTWRSIITTLQAYAAKTPHKIPILYGIDGIHGATYTSNSVLFPHSIALAASRNPELARLGAKATAADVRASGIRWNYAPVLEVARQPLWARFGETYGEDPYLISQMGVAAIKGYEEDGYDKPTGVASCMKHYLGYSAPVSGKDRTPALVPEITLREYYLPPFQAAVNAGSASIMINSADINGVPVHGSHYLLTEVLRGELGFKGLVVSDWQDVMRLHDRHNIAKDYREATKIGINAGVDMSMVPYDTKFTDHVIDLVNSKEISMERLDEACGRVLMLKYKLGILKDGGLPEKAAIGNFNPAKNKDIAVDAARQAMTLLKNDNNILPLKKGTRVLVAGPGAEKVSMLNGCWSFSWQGKENSLYPSYYTTVATELKAIAGEGNVTVEKGNKITKANADVIVLCIGEDAYAETPGSIRELDLDMDQQELVKSAYATGKPVILVLIEGRPRLVRNIEPQAKGILMAYWPGYGGSKAIAETLFGLNNPSGKLPFTYPKYSGYQVSYDYKYADLDEELEIGMFTKTGYDVQWPFGFGLSYTTFAYSEIECDTVLKGSNKLNVSVTVTNTGKVDGTEIVELYTRDHYASIAPCMRRLRDFSRVTLKAGESKKVSFAIDAEDLSFINAELKRVTEDGKFDVMISDKKKEFTYTAQ
ncbi:MAG: glycoside hydrolase family 3 N-terminal domain-containing protein [Flavobacteriales bacterium]